MKLDNDADDRGIQITVTENTARAGLWIYARVSRIGHRNFAGLSEDGLNQFVQTSLKVSIMSSVDSFDHGRNINKYYKPA